MKRRSRFALTAPLALVCFAARAEPCRPHVELVSAAELAREGGTTEAWILANHRVRVWERPSTAGRGRAVGAMLPGSRAEILGETAKDYRVRSPLDRSVGWVGKLEVERTLMLDVESGQPCEPNPGHRGALHPSAPRPRAVC